MDSAASGGDCHMDDLPDEVFAIILNLLPIEQVIRCSIVSKRWDAAYRYIIRTRESLVIAYDGQYLQNDLTGELDWNGERPSQQTDVITLDDASLVSAMMKTLNQMMELKRLYVEKYGISPEDVIPFIRKFPDQLTMLEIDFPVSMIGADSFPRLTRLRCRDFDPSSSAAFPKLAELVTCELVGDRKLPIMRLPSLKKLLFMPCYDECDQELVKSFILANADNLTFVKMNDFDLRLDHAVVFPKLIKLGCRELVVVAGCSFPALANLTVASAVTAEFLSSLPAEQMLSLDAGLLREKTDMVSAISMMKNLKSLKFIGTEWGQADSTFCNIFDNMHDLQQVQIDYSICNRFIRDRMITTLANQNLMLSHVSFERICLTDAALTSLAQLQHLTEVRIFESQKLTTAGILTLLRGASRNKISKFSVFQQNVDRDQVTSEIRLMCEERGTTFDTQYSIYFFGYEIHV